MQHFIYIVFGKFFSIKYRPLQPLLRINQKNEIHSKRLTREVDNLALLDADFRIIYGDKFKVSLLSVPASTNADNRTPFAKDYLINASKVFCERKD